MSDNGKHIGVSDECYRRLKLIGERMVAEGKSVRLLRGKPVVSMSAVVEMLCADILEGK